MTPKQRAAKAKRAHDAYEAAYTAAADLMRDPRYSYSDRDRETLDEAHRVFRDLRSAADHEVRIIAEVAAVNACREVRREADHEALVIAEAEGEQA